jgi:hypothetical protein
VAVALPLDADPNGDVYHVFVALLDREVPDAVPDDVTARIVSTIRG